MSNKDKEIELIQYAFKFQMALMDVVSDEIDEEGADITDILTGMSMGFFHTLNKLTQRNGGYLDGVDVANKLIVQYLMKYGSIKPSAELRKEGEL